MQECPIAAASARPLWILLPILLIVGGLLSVALLGAYTSRAEISPQGLRLRGGLDVPTTAGCSVLRSPQIPWRSSRRSSVFLCPDPPRAS